MAVSLTTRCRTRLSFLSRGSVTERAAVGRHIEVLSRDFGKQSRFASGLIHLSGTSVQSLVPLFQLLGRVWRLLAIDKLFAIVLCQLLRRLSACEGARDRRHSTGNSVWRCSTSKSASFSTIQICRCLPGRICSRLPGSFRSIVLHGLTPNLWHVPRKSEFLAHPSVLELSLLSLLLVHWPCLFHQLHRCSEHLFWSDWELTGGVRSRATPKSETRRRPCGLQPDTTLGWTVSMLFRAPTLQLASVYTLRQCGVHQGTCGREQLSDFLLHFARLREAQRGAKRSEAMPSHATPRHAKTRPFQSAVKRTAGRWGQGAAQHTRGMLPSAPSRRRTSQPRGLAFCIGTPVGIRTASDVWSVHRHVFERREHSERGRCCPNGYG